MTLKETIQKHFAVHGEATPLPITYSCHTTQTNSEYITAKVSDFSRTEYHSDPRDFILLLNETIDSLREEFPHIHAITRNVEFHFHYHGFNSLSHHVSPIEISIKNPKDEIQKTGKITEKYSMIGKKKVLEIIKAHPDYEIYSRTGFAYRGAGEGKTSDMDDLIRTLDWMACADVHIQDNEIHINAFSANDMW